MSTVERAREEGALISYEIGRTSAHDLLEVVEIEEASGLSRWGWESYNAELARRESIMLVARRRQPDATGRRLYGFVAARVSADELHINNIGVRDEARRRGLGGALLAAALRAGLRLGAESALLEVRAGNLAAQALYRRRGFEVVGRRRNYYREPPEDALVMRARLK
jgi:[ribosomal protein S18]-alanine N-acetyltransferase